jgi:hypothetical protein
VEQEGKEVLQARWCQDKRRARAEKYLPFLFTSGTSVFVRGGRMAERRLFFASVDEATAILPFCYPFWTAPTDDEMCAALRMAAFGLPATRFNGDESRSYAWFWWMRLWEFSWTLTRTRQDHLHTAARSLRRWLQPVMGRVLSDPLEGLRLLASAVVLDHWLSAHGLVPIDEWIDATNIADELAGLYGHLRQARVLREPLWHYTRSTLSRLGGPGPNYRLSLPSARSAASSERNYIISLRYLSSESGDLPYILRAFPKLIAPVMGHA